eukprot:8943685-Lingulodinium_polyedra.AAC.1
MPAETLLGLFSEVGFEEVFAVVPEEDTCRRPDGAFTRIDYALCSRPVGPLLKDVAVRDDV